MEDKLYNLFKCEKIVNEEFIAREDTYNIALGGGMPPLLNKVIYEYSLDGNFVKEWHSITEASNFYNCSGSSIGNAITFKRMVNIMQNT